MGALKKGLAKSKSFFAFIGQRHPANRDAYHMTTVPLFMELQFVSRRITPSAEQIVCALLCVLLPSGA